MARAAPYARLSTPTLLPVFRRLILTLLVLGGVAAAIWFTARPKPVTVELHVVARGTVEATVANTRAGTVQVHRRARLAPSIGGQVSRLLVGEGDRVAEGQVLMELWHADLNAQLALAESEAARATAAVEEVRLRAELSEREAQRQLELQVREVAAEQRVDRAVSEAKALRAAQHAAEAEAAVRRSQIDVVKAQLERTVLKAPFAGIVAEVNAELGEFATPSPVGIPTPPAVDLIDDSAPYVSAPIDEVDAARVQPGMEVRVTLDAFRGRALPGRVRRVAPYVLDREKQARTLEVTVDLVDPPRELVLLPGYSADIEVLLERRADVLRVPSEALREGNKVFVLGVDGVLAERDLRIGLANWRFTEVTGGLEPGARIVTSLGRPGVAAGARAVEAQ